MSSPLEELAWRYAILPAYDTTDRGRQRAPDATLRRLLASVGVAAETPEQQAESLAVAPEAPSWQLRAPDGEHCYMPPWLEQGRAWGVAIQLYALRSSRNWGIGDFRDLADFARIAATAGADFVGVNPLHALFLSNPHHCSPFSPSNRRFLNPVYIAVDDVDGYESLQLDPARISALHLLREADLVDYPAVTSLKVSALRAIWRDGSYDRRALEQFREAGGEALRLHALFEAISEYMVQEGHGAGWRGWPEAWHDPAGRTVAEFAESNADDVAFHAWLQSVCSQQLEMARRAAADAGMRIGLFLDFAVGEAPDGSSTWSAPDVTLRGVRVGAPPDYFNAAGQDWGLAPLSPSYIAAHGTAAFRALMQDVARGAGALRIDHAMALWQLFVIPDGCKAADGTYVRFPIEDMVRALAAASHTNRTIMIGEDLGNVPGGFREVMDAANILSYRVLFFERRDTGFIPMREYPRNALVCLSTHDLPTFNGWWRGDDIDLRAKFSLIGADAAREQANSRRKERHDLLSDLQRAGLLAADNAAGRDPALEPWPELVAAVHAHLAHSPSRLFVARLEDLVGQREPVNLPSTTDEYPNWRRKLAVPVEELAAHPLFGDITSAVRDARPRATQ